MKIVINDCYGGFGIRDDIMNYLRSYDVNEENLRTNPILIGLIESGREVSAEYADLKVVDIPDESTDYLIDEYDGMESILYVIDGKIHRSC